MEIKMHYINRRQRPDRNEKMLREMEKTDFTWKRIEGVECTLDVIRENNHLIADVWHVLQNMGHFGCFLSHISVLEEIGAMADGSHGIVFEDDVILVPDFSHRVRQILSQCKYYDMIYLYIPAHRMFVETYDANLYRLYYGYEGLYGYIITPSHARFLLEHIKHKPFFKFIDRMVAHLNHYHNRVILCPQSPLLWTDVSMHRDSDTLPKKVFTSSKIPFVLHFHKRSPHENEKPFIKKFRYFTYDTMEECRAGQSTMGGFVIPTDYVITHPLAIIAIHFNAFGFYGSDFSACIPHYTITEADRIAES